MKPRPQPRDPAVQSNNNEHRLEFRPLPRETAWLVARNDGSGGRESRVSRSQFRLCAASPLLPEGESAGLSLTAQALPGTPVCKLLSRSVRELGGASDVLPPSPFPRIAATVSEPPVKCFGPARAGTNSNTRGWPERAKGTLMTQLMTATTTERRNACQRSRACIRRVRHFPFQSCLAASYAWARCMLFMSRIFGLCVSQKNLWSCWIAKNRRQNPIPRAHAYRPPPPHTGRQPARLT